MDLFTVMTTFVRVVETGSFTAVAREQGTLQPAISKQIKWLESHLGNRLIERTTRRLAFTKQALSYYDQCKTILDAVLDAEKSVQSDQTSISGNLRISASVGFGSFQIAPHLPAFVTRYPDVSVDLRLSDTYVDVVGEGIDIAFRLGQAGDATVISKRLGLVAPILVASAIYCVAHGRPQALADLSKHACIVISGRESTAHWRFDNNDAALVPPKSQLTTDSGIGARALVLADAGIAFLPEWLFTQELQSGLVERLLPATNGTSVGLFAVMPLSRRHSTKGQVFLDYLTQILSDQGGVYAN
jgi:DNA-binding transcriptional LysR family regulator